MSRRRFNVERSREIRQWIMLIGKAITGGVMLDAVLNEGKTTGKIISKLKIKIADLKAKLSKKQHEETVENYINF